ncbi:hypothetical protein AAFM46_08120 [Arthrobacter sp. TMP15]|uniref:hypothetical protein n=1 Tax=Arthrobacter sp. TMP15 TaxID=3140789 RepID=UPI0031BB5C3C
MKPRITRLEDVSYYLPLYDEDGDQDYEAFYHRNLLALGRDFGLTGVSDGAASEIRSIFPEIENAADTTPEIRTALIGIGKLIEQDNPEDPRIRDRIEVAIAELRDHLTIK